MAEPVPSGRSIDIEIPLRDHVVVEHQDTVERVGRGDQFVPVPGINHLIDEGIHTRILDASGEPVLQNRTRVGSIGDVSPGQSEFALRISVPAGTPGPFVVKNARARGFNAPVRSRIDADDVDNLLPLEQGIVNLE